ncbi:BgTH12-01802 [Blumeria graminis f. sp. triticale]|uniref:Bgt-50244 n=2 Tax=Blumeria graminis TaxID=34373 RepID=A0A9X9MFI2_BLUGR|nr:putative secreted effector protein [Blumeria graminis f. sp. tritici 96224]CAD6501551.1 BgTH12-01802 [Blumeria graminis f. sp. triticale]VDB84102.1 Bgt-50244 [Blumeria graminis f. sp. tritici]
MHCAYAFLLIPQQPLSRMGRSVVLGAENAFSHYGVYRPLIPDKFPEISSGRGIVMTKYSASALGTHVRANCSFNVQMKDIVAAIITGHDDITPISHINFGVKEEELGPCLAHIQQLSIGYDSTSAISLEKLIKSNHCSLHQVFSLNFRQEPATMEKNGIFAIQTCSGNKWIDADVPVDIKRIFLPDQVYDETHQKPDKKFRDIDFLKIIVWYQGHLYAFQKCVSQLSFISIAHIGTEAYNAEKLQSSLLENFERARKFVVLIKGIRKASKKWGSFFSPTWPYCLARTVM